MKLGPDEDDSSSDSQLCILHICTTVVTSLKVTYVSPLSNKHSWKDPHRGDHCHRRVYEVLLHWWASRSVSASQCSEVRHNIVLQQCIPTWYTVCTVHHSALSSQCSPVSWHQYDNDCSQCYLSGRHTSFAQSKYTLWLVYRSVNPLLPKICGSTVWTWESNEASLVQSFYSST